MTRFARGRRALGVCDRCGFTFLLNELRYEVVDRRRTNHRVCRHCWSADHSQLQVGKTPVVDAGALFDPRPDSRPADLTNIRWSWNPVYALEGRLHIGAVTVSITPYVAPEPAPTPAPSPSPSPTPSPAPEPAPAPTPSESTTTGFEAPAAMAASVGDTVETGSCTVIASAVSSIGLTGTPVVSTPNTVTVTGLSATGGIGSVDASEHIYVATTGNDTTGTGRSAAPYRTLNKAYDMCVAGNTIIVRDGTYTEDLYMIGTAGTATNRITVRAENKWGAKIIGYISPREDYITVKWFDLTNPSGSQGIEIDGGDNCYIIENYVHDIPGGVPAFGGAGIHDYQCTGTIIEGNLVARIDNNYSSPAYLTHGIYIEGTNVIVRNNVVHNCQGQGIHVWHEATAVTITHNTLFRNKAGGIMNGGTGAGGAVNDNSIVANNIVVYNGQFSGTIQGMGVMEDGVTGLNNIYANNLVFGNTRGEYDLQNGLTPTGNVNADPVFVNYQTDGSGDYNLQATSPAIGAASATYAAATDFAGNPRTSTYDIGAYELVTRTVVTVTGLSATGSVGTVEASEFIYVATTGNDTTGTGRASAPYATMSKAYSVAAPGNTIIVKDGTYTQDLYMMTTAGTATNRITVRAENKWGAKIIGYISPRMDYITVKWFDLSIGNGFQGIEIDNGDHCHIIENYVHDIQGGVPSNGGAGIHDYQCTGTIIEGNVVARIDNNYGSPAYLTHGIYIEGTNAIVRNNIVHNCQGQGIHVWHEATAVTITHNTLFRNKAGGIMNGCTGANGSINNNSVVANNIVAFNGQFSGSIQGMGIMEDGVTGTSNIYTNNIVYSNTRGQYDLQNGLTPINAINADPLFVNYQANGSGNYNLQAGSPAVGTASVTYAAAKDIAGTARPQGAVADIGAYERT
jgi:parallel beta-helix repeat protein